MYSIAFGCKFLQNFKLFYQLTANTVYCLRTEVEYYERLQFAILPGTASGVMVVYHKSEKLGDSHIAVSFFSMKTSTNLRRPIPENNEAN